MPYETRSRTGKKPPLPTDTKSDVVKSTRKKPASTKKAVTKSVKSTGSGKAPKSSDSSGSSQAERFRRVKELSILTEDEEVNEAYSVPVDPLAKHREHYGTLAKIFHAFADEDDHLNSMYDKLAAKTRNRVKVLLQLKEEHKSNPESVLAKTPLGKKMMGMRLRARGVENNEAEEDMFDEENYDSEASSVAPSVVSHKNDGNPPLKTPSRILRSGRRVRKSFVIPPKSPWRKPKVPVGRKKKVSGKKKTRTAYTDSERDSTSTQGDKDPPAEEASSSKRVPKRPAESTETPQKSLFTIPDRFEFRETVKPPSSKKRILAPANYVSSTNNRTGETNGPTHDDASRNKIAETNRKHDDLTEKKKGETSGTVRSDATKKQVPSDRQLKKVSNPSRPDSSASLKNVPPQPVGSEEEKCYSSDQRNAAAKPEEKIGSKNSSGTSSGAMNPVVMLKRLDKNDLLARTTASKTSKKASGPKKTDPSKSNDANGNEVKSKKPKQPKAVKTVPQPESSHVESDRAKSGSSKSSVSDEPDLFSTPDSKTEKPEQVECKKAELMKKPAIPRKPSFSDTPELKRTTSNSTHRIAQDVTFVVSAPRKFSSSSNTRNVEATPAKVSNSDSPSSKGISSGSKLDPTPPHGHMNDATFVLSDGVLVETPPPPPASMDVDNETTAKLNPIFSDATFVLPRTPNVQNALHMGDATFVVPTTGGKHDRDTPEHSQTQKTAFHHNDVNKSKHNEIRKESSSSSSTVPPKQFPRAASQEKIVTPAMKLSGPKLLSTLHKKRPGTSVSSASSTESIASSKAESVISKSGRTPPCKPNMKNSPAGEKALGQPNGSNSKPPPTHNTGLLAAQKKEEEILDKLKKGVSKKEMIIQQKKDMQRKKNEEWKAKIEKKKAEDALLQAQQEKPKVDVKVDEGKTGYVKNTANTFKQLMGPPPVPKGHGPHIQKHIAQNMAGASSCPDISKKPPTTLSKIKDALKAFGSVGQLVTTKPAAPPPTATANTEHAHPTTKKPEAKTQQVNHPTIPANPMSGDEDDDDFLEMSNDGDDSFATADLTMEEHNENVNTYDITVYEDLDDNMRHRENKRIPLWAADDDKLHLTLFLQQPDLLSLMKKPLFPNKNIGYKIFPNVHY